MDGAGESRKHVLNMALAAARNADIDQTRFRQVGPDRWKQVLDRIFMTFTRSGRSHRHSAWMWEDFKPPYYCLKREHLWDTLIELDAPTTRVWFVLGESPGADGGEYCLFEGDIAAVVEVLKELHCFEFYIVGNQMDWLVAENHHNMLVGVGEIAVRRLRALDDEG